MTPTLQPTRRQEATRLPLTGVRVLDLTQMGAGPYCTQHLAFLGADVIKLDTLERIRLLRGRSALPWVLDQLNIYKRSATLDLRNPDAIQLSKSIIPLCDVVVENYRPGVLDKMGLGYGVLRRLRPDIILASASACGAQGPYRHFGGFAPIFSAMAGLSHLTGYEDGPPTEMRMSIDLRVGTACAFPILAALRHRQRTGKGQFIDVSFVDAITSLVGHTMLEPQMTGRTPARRGNRDDSVAPHNCYPCQGTDRWVSIAVGGEEEWQAFCRVTGHTEWAEDPRFADAYARKRHEPLLDALVAQWTRERTARQVMTTLQEVGVAAIPTFDARDLAEDPHVRERGFYAPYSTGEGGTRVAAGPQWHLPDAPADSRERAIPMLGQHNTYVFQEMLGMDADDVERLTHAKVIS
ncbi:MAG: CoA transferase [Dehalococcoidia bacterium]|nr:CoA transferase [Dehalococcoidia bacterium]